MDGPSLSPGMEIVIVGDSIAANSVGRVISLAITAKATGASVEVFAYDDGPRWPGIAQFGVPVAPVDEDALHRLVQDIAARSVEGLVVVWVSKGAHPLDRFARAVRQRTRAVILADFDDDDVAIMRNFRSQSLNNRLVVHPLHRKHPRRLRESQHVLAEVAHGTTFSSATLAQSSRSPGNAYTNLTAVVPHTREDTGPLRSDRTSRFESLRLGFFGTVRSHKGADVLVSLLEADESVRICSFEQRWRAPASVAERWISVSPSEPIAGLYAGVDFLVLPMNPLDPASTRQLPAKLIDAAMLGCPVASTSTPVVEEFARGAYLQINDWSDPKSALRRMRQANVTAMSESIRDVYSRAFSPVRTAGTLSRLIDEVLSS